MHRQTPLNAAFVGYSSGGARTLIDTIDDSKLMQQMKGGIMGESRDGVESPQNYGFSSVVREATKDASGNITDGAEGFMSYFGGSRTSNFCAVMDDRRYRPLGLKPGENCQYDDVAQMTLIRRTGVYLLSNDNPEDNQSQSSSSGSTPGQRDDSGGSSGQSTERMVSLRHVEKKKQQRPSRGGGGQSNGSSSGGASSGGVSARDGSSNGSSSGSAQDYKHEGETVNTEVRATKKYVQILDGETVVAQYEKASGTWTFTSKNITLHASDAMTVQCDSTLDIKGKPIRFNGGGPETPPFTVPG